jgi:uncharacterized protein YbjT (DUF2867 family)
MRVVVAGGHGKIGMALLQLLADGGHEAVGLIRNPDQAGDLRAIGAEALVLDLEAAEQVELAGDAVVFAAGAGPGSGGERKWTMDYGGAAKLMRAGPRRYVMVSSVGAERPPDGDDVFSVYLRAKSEADQAVAASDRAWTIVRPGPLTDEAATGRVRLGTEPFRDAVSRADVAAVLAAVLAEPRSAGLTLYLADGDDPVEGALAALLA